MCIFNEFFSPCFVPMCIFCCFLHPKPKLRSDNINIYEQVNSKFATFSKQNKRKFNRNIIISDSLSDHLTVQRKYAAM